MIEQIDLRQITTKGLLSGRKYGELLAANQAWSTTAAAVEIIANDTDLVSSSFFVGIMSVLRNAKAWRLIGGSERTQDEYQRALRHIQGLNHGQHCNISKTWYHLRTSAPVTKTLRR